MGKRKAETGRELRVESCSATEERGERGVVFIEVLPVTFIEVLPVAFIEVHSCGWFDVIEAQ